MINSIPIALSVLLIFKKSKTPLIIPVSGVALFSFKIFSSKGSKSAKPNDSKNENNNIRNIKKNTYALNGLNKLNKMLINF